MFTSRTLVNKCDEVTLREGSGGLFLPINIVMVFFGVAMLYRFFIQFFLSVAFFI